jgi:hypothetical protein
LESALRTTEDIVSDIRSITYEGGASVTQSDSVTDPNGPFAALEATTAAGVAKVTCINGDVLTVYLPLGLIKPLAVKQVWTSVTAATGIIGYRSNPYRPVINPGTGTVLP